MPIREELNLNSDQCLPCVKKIEEIAIKYKQEFPDKAAVSDDDRNRFLRQIANYSADWFLYGFLRFSPSLKAEKILERKYETRLSQYSGIKLGDAVATFFMTLRCRKPAPARQVLAVSSSACRAPICACTG